MKKRREALSQRSRRVRTAGDPEVAATLARAWRRSAHEEPDRLTHGFHSWPARMHWAIARTIIEAVDANAVLDPFCGGGTVLIEARVAGRAAIGSDLNPLAPLLSDVKTRAPDADERAAFDAAARGVAARSEDRVRSRTPIRVDLPPEEIEWYAVHVLKELGGLLEEIDAVDDPRLRRALVMVFSSIVHKVSRQRSDTDERVEERRIRKGLTTEIFLRKAHELSERWALLTEKARGPAPELYLEDARNLSRLMGTRRADLVLTSPPYGGTYDYASHHRRRIAWLGLSDRELAKKEIGSRRQLSQRGGEGIWERDMNGLLGALAGVTRDDGSIVLVLGDADIGGARVGAETQVARLAPNHGLVLRASASVPRDDWRGGKKREEHLLVLQHA